MAKKERGPTLRTMSEVMRELLPYTQLGWQLVAAMLLFFWIGYALDAWLDTGALFTVTLSVIGTVLGLMSMIRSAMHLEQQRKSKDR